MKVHWTDNAIAHLLNIYEYIALDSSVYAKRMIDKITRRSEQIGNFPMSGRKVLEYEADDVREMIEKPYRIIYRIKPDQLVSVQVSGFRYQALDRVTGICRIASQAAVNRGILYYLDLPGVT